jgi:hypothetical protein
MRGLALLLLLAACGSPPAADSGIACRPDCTVERAGDLVIVRKADGGFRRLRLTREGIVAADGAERAEAVRLRDGSTEVTIGGDRFRIGPL